MDRRFLLALGLMTIIIVAPAILFKRNPAPVTAAADSVGPAAAPSRTPQTAAPAPAVAAPAPTPIPTPTTTAVGPDVLPEDTVLVQAELYRYGISTRGGRVVLAELLDYRSMRQGDPRDTPAQLVPERSLLLALRLVVGQDTLPLDDWDFRPSARRLSVTEPTSLRLEAARGGVAVRLDYRFVPETYQIEVTGAIAGVGPNGGTLLVGLGPRLAETEANVAENQRAMGFVTKHSSADFTRFGSLDAGEVVDVSGPFDWVAVKSKYFVTGVLAFDQAGGGIAGVRARALAEPAGGDPTQAEVWLGLPVGADGAFAYRLYAGPMEYSRLAAIGHDFDDVNPYGWPGFRTIIRPLAVAVRWLLVWLHDNLHLAYGMVLVLFGIMMRVVLWPLNQKAMRASIRMQAIQPLMKDIQDRHKGDPQKLQQEMFKLYKEHNVNPFGGCWPMLLPMPVLFALFFVFQNTIELRGESFLWLPDLAARDPLFIIPVVMGLSMYFLSKVGQMGMAPNPQMKMMLYVMPIMMTVLFFNFASGLNLYYAVSNIASIPQQWLVAHERLKSQPKTADPAPAPKPEGKGKKGRR